MRTAPQIASRVSGLANVVLADRVRSRRSILYGGFGLALALHAGALMWARGMQDPAPKPAPAPEPEIEIEPAVMPLPSPEEVPEPPAPRQSPPSPSPRPRVATHVAHAPSPPAQAASVIAQETDPSAALDFSATDFVTGTASAYAGGATASTGTSTHAVSPSPAHVATSKSGRGSASLAKPVTLALEEWQCPWPHEAEQDQIDEQTVTLRVLVATDGHARAVTLVADPGHGFGAAARACALLTRFMPASDEQGRGTQAWSPPIRVHFMR